MKLKEAVQVAREVLYEKYNLVYNGIEMLGGKEAEAYNLLARYHEKISELDLFEENEDFNSRR